MGAREDEVIAQYTPAPYPFTAQNEGEQALVLAPSRIGRVAQKPFSVEVLQGHHPDLLAHVGSANWHHQRHLELDDRESQGFDTLAGSFLCFLQLASVNLEVLLGSFFLKCQSTRISLEGAGSREARPSALAAEDAGNQASPSAAASHFVDPRC